MKNTNVTTFLQDFWENNFQQRGPWPGSYNVINDNIAHSTSACYNIYDVTHISLSLKGYSHDHIMTGIKNLDGENNTFIIDLSFLKI